MRHGDQTGVAAKTAPRYGGAASAPHLGFCTAGLSGWMRLGGQSTGRKSTRTTPLPAHASYGVTCAGRASRVAAPTRPCSRAAPQTRLPGSAMRWKAHTPRSKWAMSPQHHRRLLWAFSGLSQGLRVGQARADAPQVVRGGQRRGARALRGRRATPAHQLSVIMTVMGAVLLQSLVRSSCEPARAPTQPRTTAWGNEGGAGVARRQLLAPEHGTHQSRP